MTVNTGRSISIRKRASSHLTQYILPCGLPLAALACAALLGFMLIAAPPVEAAADQSPAGEDNVVILLDGSGSMRYNMGSTGQTRIDTARAALRKVLETIDDGTRIGLLVFNERLADKWVHPLGPLDRKSLSRSLGTISPLGGTPLGEYLRTAANALLEAREKNMGYGTYRMIVVTDGEADDSRDVDRIVPQIMGRGLTVDVIGVAMKQSHTLATKVNSYRRADDPEALVKALKEVFAEIQAGPGGDGASIDFSAIEPIGGEMAIGMLQALGNSGNSPVGTKAKQADAAAAGTSNPPGAQKKSPPKPSGETYGYGLLFVVIMFFLSLPSKKKNKSGHRG